MTYVHFQFPVWLSLSTYHHVSDSSSNIQDRCCAYTLVAMSAVEHICKEHKDVRNFEDLLQRHALREEEMNRRRGKVSMSHDQ